MKTMKMKKDELPYRLRDFLPAFGPRPRSKRFEQIEGMAEFLGKQPRTVEAYCSIREDRTISPDDYWKVAVEWVKRRSRSTMAPNFIVLDDNGDQLFECRWLWQAQFLADVERDPWVAMPPVTCIRAALMNGPSAAPASAVWFDPNFS